MHGVGLRPHRSNAEGATSISTGPGARTHRWAPDGVHASVAPPPPATGFRTGGGRVDRARAGTVAT
ncbi:MAG: hypothetical protein AVDCRST_MAG32-109 [uncultured Nocardioides sp.]|uniref:Uncharacterized protein n=1 Tax=uncultured Nocardioides sp. TaxID=198441 RepID=A0A6J4MTK8_9ACTN|nr:MAG: hypothetical protein AVDCRST_MAG32-109 [uncultured Nocardioides sp.]